MVNAGVIALAFGLSGRSVYLNVIDLNIVAAGVVVELNDNATGIVATPVIVAHIR